MMVLNFLRYCQCNKPSCMGQGDDAIDIDQAYAGTIDGALVVLTAASDHGFEIDGLKDHSRKIYPKNATVIGATDDCDAEGVDGEMADFRKGATGDVLNVLFKDFLVVKMWN